MTKNLTASPFSLPTKHDFVDLTLFLAEVRGAHRPPPPPAAAEEPAAQSADARATPPPPALVPHALPQVEGELQATFRFNNEILDADTVKLIAADFTTVVEALADQGSEVLAVRDSIRVSQLLPLKM